MRDKTAPHPTYLPNDTIMTIKQLKEAIKDLNDNTKIIISNDEELNNLYSKLEVAKLTDLHNTFVIYPLSTSLIDS